MRVVARLLTLTVAGHLTLTGCERIPPTETAPTPVSISLDTPDESFRLDAAERANIGPDYDPDALERLLQLVHPDHRMDILANFQIKPFDGRKGVYYIEILDPKLQPLLDPVYAPVWQNATDEEIEANIYGLPGRATAMQQRMMERRRDIGDATP